jgi:hypothetical protein
MRERAEGHARMVRDSIRATEFRTVFQRRRIVVALLGEPEGKERVAH